MADKTRHTGLSQRLSCTLGRFCSDLPGACIVVQILVVTTLTALLGYLFVTREIIG